MVSTRHHPRAFPEPPTVTPRSTSLRASSNKLSSSAVPSTSSSPAAAASGSPSPPASDVILVSPSPATAVASTRRSNTNSSSATKWKHTPSYLTLLWLAISLPLVLWDTGYVLLRPYSMPGGSLHAPIWSPYALYGTVDYIYGFPAWNARNGFTAAQAALNLVETAGYIWYLMIVALCGTDDAAGRKGRGAPKKAASAPGFIASLSKARVVPGRYAAIATLLGFSTAVMTLSKTVLYWLNEAFSGFDNIGHNDISSLIFLWIIPNGLWLVFPTYMIVIFTREIIQGLDIASGESKKHV